MHPIALGTLKNMKNIPGGLSYTSGGLSPGAASSRSRSRSSTRQEGSSPLLASRGSQVCSCHFLGVLISNFQDTVLDLISASPQPDKHMMGQMDTKDTKEQQEEEEMMMYDSCIFCGAEPKAGHVHLQLLHKVQVFKSKSKHFQNLDTFVQFRDKLYAE